MVPTILSRGLDLLCLAILSSTSSLMFFNPYKLKSTKQKTFASYYVKSDKKKIKLDLRQLNPIHHEFNLHHAKVAEVSQLNNLSKKKKMVSRSSYFFQVFWKICMNFGCLCIHAFPNIYCIIHSLID